MGLFEGWEPSAAPTPGETPAPQPWHRPQPAPARQPFGAQPIAAAPPIDTTGTDDERIAFTVAMLRDGRDPMGIAIRLFGSARAPWCAAISSKWPASDWFALLKQELIEEYGEAHFLPSKEQVARELYNVASSTHYDPENSLKFYKLYCEVMDYVKTAGGASVTLNDNRTNVMLVKDNGTDDEWEEKCRAQQAKLVSAA